MRTIVIILLLFAAGSVAAQTGSCELGVESSPSAAGLKIGITEPEIAKIFKAKRAADVGDVQIKDGTKTFLVVTALAKYDKKKYTLPQVWTALDSIEIKTVGGKVTDYTLWFDYKAVPIKNVRDLAEAASRSYNLPMSAWKYFGSVAKMVCSGFNVTAATTGQFAVEAIKTK